MLKVSNTTIHLTRGDTARIQITLSECDGAAYEPSEGDSIRFAATPEWGELPCIEKAIPTDTLLLELSPADTKQLEFGEYWYDIELTRSNGDVDTFIDRAKLVIREEVE